MTRRLFREREDKTMIKVAIIGTGNISHLHIPAYLRFPERARIVALVDIIPGKAQKVKEEFGLDCEVYLDHHEILGREDIDLFDVCTPPYVHAEISINAMKAGKNVICEKPMAPSLAECDEMIRVRNETGVKLSIIAQNRFRKPIRDLKALLDSGIAGPVRHASVDSLWWRGHCYYDLWWRGTWEKEGGGCTLNHAVHHIDMLGWMMGLPKRVTSVLANTAHDNAEVEDLSISILEYPGALASLTASVYASLSKPNGFPERNEALEKEISDFADALPPVPYIGHDGQIENVLTAIEQDTDVAITAEDGRRTIELITAVYKAGATRTAVDLPLQPEDPFYTVEGIMKAVPHFYEKTKSEIDLGGADITVGSNYGEKK